ncbi:MAG: nucleotidyltransferase domain-containing protein [Cytophagales bacterium]|nr:MAG: nucleotidyltransferase domain-containing protein [Cytophagales bacterium]
MRISKEEKKVFLDAVSNLDIFAKVFVFGSRALDSKKGGDIDLIIQSNVVSEKDYNRLQYYFFMNLEEQKIDLLFTKDFSEPFANMIKNDCIELKYE